MDRGVFCSMVEAETTTLGQLLERYLQEVVPGKRSRDTLKSAVKILDAAMGHLVLAAITPLVVKEYRDWRLEQVSEETSAWDRHSLPFLPTWYFVMISPWAIPWRLRPLWAARWQRSCIGAP
jgi:hypothetical protein